MRRIGTKSRAVFPALRRRAAGVALATVAVLGLTACATPPSDPVARAEFEAENDPLEPLNRAIFDFNKVVDGMFLRPAAVVYREVLPRPAQRGVNNFLANLRSPVVLANDLLQGEMERAGNTAGRFLINTTVGLLGVWDAAGGMGIPRHSEDFGQTFATWGVGEGFYLVLPIFGPSNPRDAAGLLVEWYVDPVNIWLRNDDMEGWIIARSLVTGVDFRSRNLETMDEIERTSLDHYAAIRSLYRQRRAEEIRNSRPSSGTIAPGISGAPDETPATESKTSQAF